MARRYTINHDYFCQPQAAAQAYILGFLWADGHLRGDGYGVTIKINKRDIDILHYIKTQLGSTHPIKPRSEDRVLLDLCSARMAASLADLGFQPNKTFATHLPIHGEDPLPFVRGLFDGDGSIHQDRRGQWHMQVTGSHATCQFILSVLGCGNVYSDGSVYKWQVGGSRQVRKISRRLLQYSDLPVTRKVQRLQEVVAHGNTKDL